MKFKIGDYAVHKEYPKSKTILHITEGMHKEVVNAQSDNFRHATESEIEMHHLENN